MLLPLNVKTRFGGFFCICSIAQPLCMTGQTKSAIINDYPLNRERYAVPD
ncbi:hypothetical protein SCA50_3075 [Salmonella enterica subsp. enterica serovar Choleraesuis str. SCSA50]|uniref:Uncharacterized protein n=2 Tax=Salmonella enterica subsp. enterica serovar Choleraesuis TaxID=119912 RepID=Q57KH1_SALCH|nr:hypothetical protein SCH_2885 [Salmonella enterica subsp. enterica serovar Choleraesuis str. SC-B67]EFZ07510.1 hypothetical protein SCA50_3075 [Salmonella enterica subsp. enterica serovar Choleraesuis str. SCSA50]